MQRNLDPFAVIPTVTLPIYLKFSWQPLSLRAATRSQHPGKRSLAPQILGSRGKAAGRGYWL